MDPQPPAPAAAAGGAVAGDAAREPGRPEGSGVRSRVGGGREVPLRLRLGRARRRAGPGTPTPSWKMEEDREAGVGEAVAAVAARRSSASARQLGASLWEIHDVAAEARRGRGRRAARREDGTAATGGGRDVGQGSGGNGGDSSMKHHKLHEERSHRIQPFSPASYTSSVGDSNVNRTISPARSLDIIGQSRGRETCHSLKTSTELLKVLNRIWSLEEQHTANLSVVDGLKLELQQAQTHIQELMQERRRYRHEVSSLMRQLSENKLVRKSKEHGKMDATVHSLQGELEAERHLRRHSEDLHRKLGKELTEINSAFLKAVKDLEKEKKTNSLLEDLCDQFAMGIRNYEEEVRVVKQRNVKNHELNFDKSVLHISEAWLDERIQMQNIGVKDDLARKPTITERLSSEIQAFLLSKRAGSSKNKEKYVNDSISLRRQSLESVHLNGTTSAPQLAEDDDDDSVASALHCFELNMQDQMGSRRSGTGGMDVPKRRPEHPNGIAAESSNMSRLPVYSEKDISRSHGSKLQHSSKAPEIYSQSNARITPVEEQNGATSAQISRGCHSESLKNNLDAHHVDCLGQESFDHYSRTSLFCEGTTSGDLGNPSSPTRQLKYQSTSLDPEILECSPEQSVGVMENTLKAKLLQARLEGRHARLKASGGSSTRRK